MAAFTFGGSGPAYEFLYGIAMKITDISVPSQKFIITSWFFFPLKQKGSDMMMMETCKAHIP
jgi:hypothetical protein